MKEDNRLYFEDALLTWKILQVIRQEHELELERMFRHVMIKDMEIDAVAICTTYNGSDRWIGFELKDSDFYKAAYQAIVRRRYFDYFYVVLNLRVSTIVPEIFKFRERYEKLSQGIGFVSSKENVVILH